MDVPEHREAEGTSFSFITGDDETGRRLDQLVAERFTLSRGRVQELLENEGIMVDGRIARRSQRLKPGQRVEGHIPPDPSFRISAQDLPLELIYQDHHLLVINKPRGMVVHPGGGVREGTLVNALLHHCPDLAGVGEESRPGIVHRLDRHTSGCLVVARTARAQLELRRQFDQRLVRKEYLALVHGRVTRERGEVDSPLGRHPVVRQKFCIREDGRSAITRWRVLADLNRWTLLSIELLTGRTHQIRVHMTALGYPVVGDPTYGRRRDPWNLAGQFLHAHKLGIHHPEGAQAMTFQAPLPVELAGILQELGVRAEEIVGRGPFPVLTRTDDDEKRS